MEPELTSTSSGINSRFSNSHDSLSSTSGWQPRPPYQPYRSGANASGPNSHASPRSLDAPYLPGGEKSLSGISLRAFLLGQAAGICAVLTIFFYAASNPLWRAPFFVSSLGLFHFLEYYITARYNTPFATTTAFLLTQNGAAYNIAHGSAVAECVLAHLLLPRGYFEWTAAFFGGIKYQVLLGLAMMLVGQVIRSIAMAQAGTSFTHTIQRHRREEHRLIKDGIYSIFRHPSYFGFFWWGLGTQLVLGNTVCFLGYAVVLWEFFSSRIRNEEKLLVDFFGKEYTEYRSKTWVGIPGIS